MSWSEPAPKRWIFLTGTGDTSGNNTVIAAPGEGQRLVIMHLSVQNATATASVAIWRSGASTNLLSAELENNGDSFQVMLERGNELYLPENTALVLNLSGALSHRFNVIYRDEPYTD